jgi:arylsulfatase A-like enzyme
MPKTTFSHGFLALTLVLLHASFGPVASGDERSPNIVLIFTDDQGYQDIGCFGSPKIKTPSLDRMASEGMKFTDFYSANSVCSASRAALLTGCYPPRVSISGVLFPGNKNGLHPDEITIADLLKQQGYATACIGKWHLGHKPDFLPTRQGFDSYYGIPYSNDMTIDPTMALADEIVLRQGMTVERIRKEKPKRNWVPLLRGEQVIEYPVDQSTLTQRYTEEAVKFITANKSKPFFLYLPHTMPHIPLFASEQFKGKSQRGLYGDTIEEIDWSTGQILDTLKALDLDEQTLVIYTSDNGPWKLPGGRGGHADPLRGFKFQTYEGGMRVPCIMRWPNKIPAGTTCSEIAATIDMLPTIAKLAGTTAPSDREIDGLDIWPLMSGAKDAKTPHDAYYYYRGTTLQAVRSGNWKLRIEKRKVELFDLHADISEAKNLAKQNPDVVATLKERIAKFDSNLRAKRRPAGQAAGNASKK